MGIFTILAVCIALAGLGALIAYGVQEYHDPRVSRLVLIARAAMILLIVGLLALGWYMRGAV